MTIKEYARLNRATEILAKKAQWEDVLKKVEGSKYGTAVIIFNKDGKNEQRLNVGLNDSDYGRTIYESTILGIKEKIANFEKEFAEL